MSVAEASAADNTRRAIERGSITTAQKTLERPKEELVISRKCEEESKAGCSVAQEFVREKDEELKSERARRQQAEQEKQQAEQEKQAIGREKESAVAGQRQAEERTRAMEEELALLKDSVQNLRKTNLSLLQSAGIPVVAVETQTEPEEGSIRSLEDELLLERVKAERLQRKVEHFGPLVEGLKR
ncbi:unnamed protein product [Ectocarpus sp. CCAP 1310/34]|nr:unnamed protein product [Ectocarpus sp. CCAP 1310/34]